MWRVCVLLMNLLNEGFWDLYQIHVPLSTLSLLCLKSKLAQSNAGSFSFADLVNCGKNASLNKSQDTYNSISTNCQTSLCSHFTNLSCMHWNMDLHQISNYSQDSVDLKQHLTIAGSMVWYSTHYTSFWGQFYESHNPTNSVICQCQCQFI